MHVRALYLSYSRRAATKQQKAPRRCGHTAGEERRRQKVFLGKKQLEKQISELEGELFDAQCKGTVSALIESAALPKCESLACVNCQHIVYQRHQNHLFVLGCGKGLKCPDFAPAQRGAEDRQSLQEALLSQQ